MAGADTQKMMIDGVSFNAETDYIYTKPKVNASGGKQIGILNSDSKKGLYISTPLMLTWGVNEFTDEKSGRKTYDMSLQFPKEEYNTPAVEKFLDNIRAFEAKIKLDAVKNCKEWMNKAKMSTEVVDALWTPMVKYPKDQNTGEPDYNRAPTLRLKIPMWEGEWKVELYDMDQSPLFPNDKGLFPPDLIAKATNVATVMQCGGVWFANGKFGVTWKLVQAVVKPKQSLRGQCFINLSEEDKATLDKSNPSDEADDVDEDGATPVEVADSSSDEDEAPITPAKEVAVSLAEVEPPPAPKKKVVRKKKTAEE
tara:strand:+ start:1724 stop:2653 length:930 start_codon:yes stop_codon:yes gene_type:complete